MNNTYITCKIGKQWTAINTKNVREITILKDIASTPLMPKCIAGLINLRGQIVTAIDAIYIFEGIEYDKNDILIAVLEVNQQDYGLLISKSGEVISIDNKECEKTPDSLPEKWKFVSQKVIKEEDKLIVMIDPEKIIQFGLEGEPQ